MRHNDQEEAGKQMKMSMKRKRSERGNGRMQRTHKMRRKKWNEGSVKNMKSEEGRDVRLKEQ